MMRATLWTLMSVMAGAMAWACGGSSPVKQVPLAGTVGGAPFTAVSSLASASKGFSDDGGTRWLEVYDTAIECNSYSSHPNRSIIAIIPWQVAEYELSFERNVTLVSNGSDNKVALQGRVEIVSAPQPDAGVPALVRLRAEFDSANTVEGELQVRVCD